MGILNITPDSFSDGGSFIKADTAVEHAINMVEEGADIIDIGGESTRPGSDAITVSEELERVIPVIEKLSGRIRVPISIDTYKAEVAQKAIDAGASIVNDISGLRFDPEMPGVVSRNEVSVVIMHIKGTPKNMQKNPIYGNLIKEIIEYLEESIAIAEKAGVHHEKIIVDPGIGFGKMFEDNLEIINRLSEFRRLGKPLLIGASRKAFIGEVLGDAPVGDRVEGTAAAVAISIMNGADIVRVHDVKEMKKVAKVSDAIKSGVIV
ncbi:MAG: dihydropteroate synthase [Thermodesulfovibrionia bacterium]|nr:dihydropteroate synthase [Thermodesulfovibrionia bacterium]